MGGVTTYRMLFYEPRYGGGIRNGNELKAFIPGASFPWFYPEQLDVPLDGPEVAALGSSCSGVHLLDEAGGRSDDSCVVRLDRRLGE